MPPEVLLDIAYAPSAKTTFWQRGTTTWGDICAWLEHPRTDGSKDGPGYVLGLLSSNRRTRDTVINRGVIALDADHLTPRKRDLLIDRLHGLGCAAIAYSTFSSTEEAPRLRLLILPNRPLSPEEYWLAASGLMRNFGLEMFDTSSPQHERLMYMPSAAPGQPFFGLKIEGPPLDADDLLEAIGRTYDIKPRDADDEPVIPLQGSPARPIPEPIVRDQVASALRGLDALAELSEGARHPWPGVPEGLGWDLGMLYMGERLIQAANSGAGYTLEQAQRDFCEHAPNHNRDHKWSEALKYVGQQAIPYYEHAEDVFREEPVAGRHIVLTRASQIKPRPVFWLWDGRLALGTLGLLAGREGLGKSTLGYWLAARITLGQLPGHYAGTPKGVLVCATEDSWEHTIVPRLIAVGADLDHVYRVEVVNADAVHVGLSLPRDLSAVEQAARQVDAALLLLDPLMSRLPDLDTHKDAEVRLALEPLVALADRATLAVLGLIHHNKSGSTDPLQLVMASKAFTAVARSVHTVMLDPEDDTDTRRLFGTPKNNLGRSDLPTLSFTIHAFDIATDEGVARTGRLVWGEEMGSTIGDNMRRSANSHEERSLTAEAAAWLSDYVFDNGGSVLSTDAKRDGAKAGHNIRVLRRAREKLQLKITDVGFPRVTFWGTEEGLVEPPTVEPLS